jgi:hypothetical protein
VSRHYSGLIQKCPECGAKFPVCGRCTKTHRYCSSECSSEARHRKRKTARKRYAKSDAGLESGRLRQQRYREKKKSSLEKSGDGPDLPAKDSSC